MDDLEFTHFKWVDKENEDNLTNEMLEKFNNTLLNLV